MSGSASCCCGLIPITTGTIIFSSIVIVFSLGSIGAHVYLATQPDQSVLYEIPSILTSVLEIAVAVLAIVGTTLRKPAFLNLAAFGQMFTITASVSIVVISILAVDSWATLPLVIFCVFVLFNLPLSVWFVNVMINCYNFLNEWASESLLD